MALAAFGGTCYNCQEKGRRANQCPKKDGHSNGNHNVSDNTRGNFKGEFNNYGKIGYTKSDCWQLEENKNKRPKDYHLGNAEHGNAVISSGTGDDDSDAEFLTTIRIIMALTIIFKWGAQLVDVKGAFYVGISKMEKRFSWKYWKDLKNFMEHMFYCYYCKQ
jgi:hypothetical protein